MPPGRHRRSFPLVRQHDQTDCGPAALRMLGLYYGRSLPLQKLRDDCRVSIEGVSVHALRRAAAENGFSAEAVELPYRGEPFGLLNAPLPAIAYWQQRHFVVVYKASAKRVWVADPEAGKLKLSRRDFERGWLDDNGKGVLLLLEPRPDYEPPEKDQPATPWRYLLSHLKPYRRLISQLWIGAVAVALIQFVFPFLTQAVVDIGIQNQDLGFITLILLGQLLLFLGQAGADAIQSWIFLHIGTRVNISLIGEFIEKLTRLPLSFFQQRPTGDLLQRIADHSRVEEFLTAATLNVFFSLFTLLVFSVVLFLYHPLIFLVFLLGSLLYLGWVFLFLKRRKNIDYLQFSQLSDHQHALLEIIQGMPDIKLQGSEQKRRSLWRAIQVKLFRANLRYLSLSQAQEKGGALIHQLKDILILFVAARGVVQGELTLGMMLAIQYITGQLSVPLRQISAFVLNAQDARLSLERLAEVQQQSEEQRADAAPERATGDIHLRQVSFHYPTSEAWVLRELKADIPQGKVTAVVGPSGCGKTTLMKMLLGFFPVSKGEVRIGDYPLQRLAPKAWRRQCGAVLQDGFLFSDTLAGNITEGEGPVDEGRLMQAVRMAQLEDLRAELPQGLDTPIGQRGLPLSQGQRQRVLIARALYKDPDYLFLDEATNALDAHTERALLEALRTFFAGRTVLIAAHRLSTVRDADQILVMKNGRIAEQGTHEELLKREGEYAQLVREQL